MSTFGALISIHYQTPTLSRVHHQSGIKIGDYVITVANKIFKTSEKFNCTIKLVTITYAPDENIIVQKEGLIETIWNCKEVEDTLVNSFKFSYDYKDKFVFHLSEPNHWSYFVLLKIKGSSGLLSDTICNLENYKPMSIEKGMDVIVYYSPFGSSGLFNSIGEGIISNTFGKNSAVFLTDVRLAASSDGSPVFGNDKSKKILFGILVKNIPYFNDGVMNQSGFSLGVNISVLFISLQNHMTSLKCGPIKDLVISPSRDSILRTDFIVSILVGATRGTGVIIHESGLVMTCAHVVSFKSDIKVNLRFQDDFYDAIVLFSTTKDSTLDFAFIMIESTKLFPSCQIALGPSKKGESVYCFGQGLLLDTFIPFVSKGIVSNYLHSFLFVSCLILHGSSGGVIVRPNGDVIALINSMLHNNGVPFPFISSCTPLHPFHDLIKSFIISRDVNILEQLSVLGLGWIKPKL